LVLCCTSHQVSAQPAQPAASTTGSSQIIGEVITLDAGARRLQIREDRGGSIAMSLGEKSAVLRIPPGETDVKKATRIELKDVNSGDRVLAVGTKEPDGQEMQVRTLVVMTRADIAQKQQKEQQDWQRRGVSGTVLSVDGTAKTFAVKAGQKTITVIPSSTTEFRRYAPDSVKYNDSTVSTIAELKTGDQVKVLGDRNEDGSNLKAERVVSGTFRQVAGTITAVRADAGEIRINDLASKKPMVVLVNSSSVMKKLSPVAAAALSRRFRPAGSNGGASAPASGGPSGGGDLGQVLDRLPSVPLADLKPGDAIMISGSAGADATRLTAITLLAGVEPLLTASPDAARDVMAGWNFGGEGAPE
jgi:hypothetical protein